MCFIGLVWITTHFSTSDGGGEGMGLKRRALIAQDDFNAHIKLKDQLIMVIEHWNAPCDTEP